MVMTVLLEYCISRITRNDVDITITNHLSANHNCVGLQQKSYPMSVVVPDKQRVQIFLSSPIKKEYMRNSNYANYKIFY